MGPMFAVWASEWRQQKKAERDRKERAVRTRSSTCGAKLRQEHVPAINPIEFAFPRQSGAAIDDIRALYRKHLRSPDSLSEVAGVRQAWENKDNELFADILYRMAADLRFRLPRRKSLKTLTALTRTY